MAELLALPIILAILVVVLYVARKSRKRFENQYGRVTLKDRIISFALFCLWLTFLSAFMIYLPDAFAWLYGAMLLLGFPLLLTDPSQSLGWKIQSTGFLAFICFGPIALIYFSNR